MTPCIYRVSPSRNVLVFTLFAIASFNLYTLLVEAHVNDRTLSKTLELGLTGLSVLSIGVGLELISPIITMCSFNIDEYFDRDDLAKSISLTFRIVARCALIAAYGLTYYWIYPVLHRDHFPLRIIIMDAIRSVLLVAAATWSVIPQRSSSVYIPM